MTGTQPNEAGSQSVWAERRKRVARDMLRRMVAHAAKGTTDMAPAHFENLASVYTDPIRFAAEQKELFRKQPLVAGLSCDLPSPGSMFLFEEAGLPLLVTRDGAGRVHAFVNMCTHRGAKLVRDCAPRRLLTCPFHAWGFGLDGTLAAVPGQAGFAGMDKSARGLVRVPCAEWNGIIFVKATPGDEVLDVEAHLGPMADELAQLELAGAEPVKSGVLTAASNWKFALDTYGEGYHFSTLHASTIGQTHFNNMAVYERFGRHHRVSFPDKGMAALAGKPESEWPQTEYGGVHYVFPNTVFFIGAITPGKGFVQVFRIFPGAHPGETRTLFAVYAPRGIKSPEHRADCIMAYDGTAQVVQTEDYRIASEGYANMAVAPPGFKVVYGRNELALHNQHRAIADAIGMPL